MNMREGNYSQILGKREKEINGGKRVREKRMYSDRRKKREKEKF